MHCLYGGYNLHRFSDALGLVILSSNHLHKSKTLSQLTQCPFTGTLLLFLMPHGVQGTPHFITLMQTLTLDCKFLYSGHPRYLGSLLSTRCGRFSTRYNRPDKRFFEVPKFYPSVHKSKKLFGHSFAFNDLTVWNNLLDVCSA